MINQELSPVKDISNIIRIPSALPASSTTPKKRGVRSSLDSDYHSPKPKNKVILNKTPTSCKRRKIVCDDDKENMDEADILKVSPKSEVVPSLEEKKDITILDEDPSEEERHRYSKVLEKVRELNSYEDLDENLFECRVQLFEYTDESKSLYYTTSEVWNEETVKLRWRKLGCGIIKFLRDMEESCTYGTVRLSMKHEGNTRLLLSHNIEGGLEPKRMKNKDGDYIKYAYTWVAVDYASYKRERTFAAKFFSEKDMVRWRETFEKSKIYTTRARLCQDSSEETVNDLLENELKKLNL